MDLFLNEKKHIIFEPAKLRTEAAMDGGLFFVGRWALSKKEKILGQAELGTEEVLDA